MAYRTSKEKQIQKDAMKERIMRSAAKIFEEKGYNGTTVKAIVDEAKTSVGNFYFYFKNKETLFELLYDEMLEITNKVSDFALKNCENVVEGFCRSKTSELWIFQNYRRLARAMFVEAAGLNPVFEEKRSQLIMKSNERIDQVFSNLNKSGQLNLSDTKLAALLCNGTMYSVIVDWLQRNDETLLLDYAYEIICYNLNALNIDHEEIKVREYIRKTVIDMEDNFTF